jgi:hypothetical protein
MVKTDPIFVLLEKIEQDVAIERSR